MPPLLSVPALTARLGVEITACDLTLHWVCGACGEREETPAGGAG